MKIIYLWESLHYELPYSTQQPFVQDLSVSVSAFRFGVAAFSAIEHLVAGCLFCFVISLALVERRLGAHASLGMVFFSVHGLVADGNALYARYRQRLESD